MPKIKANNVNLYYEDHGQGFPLVLIMGLAGNLDWWDPRLLNHLKKKFRIIVFDNRDTGRSEISDVKYSIKLFADDTSMLMDALNISEAHIMGFSMGGMIAQEMSLSYPEKVNKLILVSTMCGYPESVPPTYDVIDLLTEITEKETISKKDVLKFIPLLFSDEVINRFPGITNFIVQRFKKHPPLSSTIKGQLKAIMEFNTCKRLSRIAKPVLIVHGKRDILIPPENSEILAKKINNAELVFFENSGHAIAEELMEMCKKIIEFLES